MFLDLHTAPAPTEAVGNPLLVEPGTYPMTLKTCKWIEKCDKALFEWHTADGQAFQEWQGRLTAGQQNRLSALLGRLCALSNVIHTLQFKTVGDFDALGAALVTQATPMTLTLIETEWNGRKRLEFGGRFNEAINPADSDEISF